MAFIYYLLSGLFLRLYTTIPKGEVNSGGHVYTKHRDILRWIIILVFTKSVGHGILFSANSVRS